MTHEEMIAVIAAHRDGEEIQWSPKGNPTWLSLAKHFTSFDFQRDEYRIKREPRVIWVNEYDNVMAGFAHFSQQAAENESERVSALPRTAIRKFVEVLE